MAESVGAVPDASSTGVARRRFGLGWTLERDQAVWVVATLAAWGHTIDEMRIGQFVALPFALANAALVVVWSRLRRRERAITAIAFGVFWGLTAIPYHVVPLIEGELTWQNVSGLMRIVACVAMVVLGGSIARRRDDKTPPQIS